ncbi:MAG: type II secretion system F family protein [Betaproteobacteria bacterium]|nr:type II secretion system F family protein [Betaproteobacteria bacterium]MDE1981328.1 type II secretion system F family protein [Betaproteobacteria bacterium]MDE2132296.1 type II secretion system F family protein [Betaproteobacteria bacterium]MDE2211822.1 type II secretion system F family protein [Betaproteobacteria bacterium]
MSGRLAPSSPARTRPGGPRLALLRAGWRDPGAWTRYRAARWAGALLLMSGALFLPPLPAGHPALLRAAGCLAGCACGYGLPALWLRQRVRRRQAVITQALPDLLDLLMLCLEAGLSLEQSFGRLAREFARFSPLLAQELHALSFELEAGRGRLIALRHFAWRIGVPAVDSLVSLLAQAERFGTRVSDALAAQAEQVRRERRRSAERAAAVIGLKLLFPLVFCIFPGLLVVLVGPAFIGIYRTLQ